MSITYKVQRFGTNEWLHYNLPLETDGPLHTFSTYETLEGTIAPEVGRRLADDGKPLLWKGGTWIHVETEAERIWTGYVDEVWTVGAVLHVRAREWQGYLHGYTYQDQIWAVQQDPADIARQLWRDIQRKRGANLGVTVVGSVPGVKLGTHWDDTVIARKVTVNQAEAASEQRKAARVAIETQIKKVKARHEKVLKPLLKTLEQVTNQYKALTEAKSTNPLMLSLKNTLESRRNGKKNDPAIVAYKARTAAKNGDDLLRTRKWAYDDEVALQNVDGLLADRKAAYEAAKSTKDLRYKTWRDLVDAKGPAGPIATAKAAYDAANANAKSTKATYDTRRTYWENRIKPYKTAYEQRRDYFDALIKPLKRPNDVRVVYWDPLIRDAEFNYDAQVALLENPLKPVRENKQAREKVISDLKETHSEELAVFDEPLELARAAEDAQKEVLEAAKERLQSAQDSLALHGGAYKVLRQDQVDAWQVLTELRDLGGFDFTTESVLTHGAPELRLIIHAGRVGTTRDDLVFEQGRNIISDPEIREPEEYATEVIAVGAGQGENFAGIETSLRVALGVVDDSRMYRNVMVVDPSITDSRVLGVVARLALKEMGRDFFLPEITVKDDPNCPIGAWRAGDIITPRMHSVPHYGRVARKMRVRSWQRIGTGKAKLILEEA